MKPRPNKAPKDIYKPYAQSEGLEAQNNALRENLSPPNNQMVAQCFCLKGITITNVHSCVTGESINKALHCKNKNTLSHSEIFLNAPFDITYSVVEVSLL